MPQQVPPQVQPRPLAWILCLLFSPASSWFPAEGESSHYQFVHTPEIEIIFLFSILQYFAKVKQQLHTPRREPAEPVWSLSVCVQRHAINSNMIFKISRVTKKYICQTWTLYIIHASCMFDTRMKVFQDMGSIIDNWSNCHPTFEEADRCTYSMNVSKPPKPCVGLRGWV